MSTTEKKQLLKIFATGRNGVEFEVTDLYWFEENGVHDFSGVGHWETYSFRFVFSERWIMHNTNILNLPD